MAVFDPATGMIQPDEIGVVDDRMKIQRDTDAAVAKLEAEQQMQPQQQPEGMGFGSLDLYGGLVQQQQAVGQNAAAILAANPVRTVGSPNAMRPVVEKKATTYRGSAAPLPQQQIDEERLMQLEQVFPRANGEGDQEYRDRVEMAQMLGDERVGSVLGMSDEQIADSLYQNADPREIGTPGMPGLAEAERQAVEGVGAAGIDQAAAVADTKRGIADDQAAATERVASATMEATQFAQDQLRAQKTLQDAEQEARTAFAAVPAPDSQRFFKNMNGGQKFAAVLGAIAGGWNGSDRAVQTLQTMIDRDVQDQVMAYEQSRDQYGTAADAAARGVNVLGQIVDATNNIPASMAMLKKLQYEDALTELDAVIAETSVPQVKAELQNLRVGLEGQIRDQDLQIEAELATTPHTIYRRVDPLGRHQRERLEKQMDLADERAFDLTKTGAKAFDDRDLKQIEFSIDEQRRQQDLAEKRLRGEGGDFRELEKFSTKTADAQALYSATQQFLDDFERTDIAGRGGSRIADWSDANARAKAENAIENITDMLTRARSGAGLNETEIEQYKAMLKRGIGDEQLLRNVRFITQQMYNSLAPQWESLPESAQELYEMRAQKDPARARMIAQLRTGARADRDESSVVELDSDDDRPLIPELAGVLKQGGAEPVYPTPPGAKKDKPSDFAASVAGAAIGGLPRR